MFPAKQPNVWANKVSTRGRFQRWDLTSVRRVFSLRRQQILPPKSPILWDLGSSPEFTIGANHFCRTNVNLDES